LTKLPTGKSDGCLIGLPAIFRFNKDYDAGINFEQDLVGLVVDGFGENYAS